MTRIVQHKTSFTGGELSPDLYGRDDLRAYANGAARLRNVIVQPTGGVTRRPGLRHLADLPGEARLIAFDFNAEQVYLIAASDAQLRIYLPGEAAPDVTLASPFAADHLPGLNWTQSADTLLLAHPDVPPQQLVRGPDAAWRLESLSFDVTTQAGGQTVKRVPFARFGNPAVRIQPSGVTGTVGLSVTHDVFKPEHVGIRLEIKGRQLEITQFNGPQGVTAVCKEDLADTESTADWGEEAISAVRGWPRSLVFHQDRLAIGGTRDLPHHLFLSRAGRLFDFDSGEAEDDAAIDFPLMGDRVNAIDAVASGRHLQVFTRGGEWIVTGEPLTPSTVSAKPQTEIGSRGDRHVRPVTVDGATIFVGPAGLGLYEFLYTDLEQAYSTVDLTLLARHLVPQIRALAYDRGRRLLLVVTEQGTLACLTQYRSEQVTAWSLCASDQGDVLDVATPGDRTFLLVARRGGTAIEELDAAVHMDAALTGESAQPAHVWSGLDHLEAEEVIVLADDCPRGRAVVSNGAVTLDRPAQRVEIGKAFRHEIAPLPPVIRTVSGRDPAAAIRLIETVLRVRETAQLDIDLGRGLESVPLTDLVGADLDSRPPRYSGDRRVGGAGWRRGEVAPLWRLEGDSPVPLTLLSVTNELKVND